MPLRRVALLLASLTLLAFAAAGNGAGGAPPRLVVHTANAKAATAIGVRDASAVITAGIRIGAGYTLTLGQAAGARVGTMTATRITDTGTQQLAAPVTLAAPEVTACDGVAHGAVWTAALSDGTQVVATIVLAADASPAQLLVCTGGVQLDELELRLPPAVLRAPQEAVRAVFEALFTTTTGEPEASVATVTLPVRLTLRTRYDRRRHTVAVAGTLTEAGGQPTAVRRVVVLTGRTQKKLSPLGVTTTRPDGTWRGTITNARRTLYVRARVTVPDADVTATGCAVTVGAPCVSATASGYSVTSPVVQARIP